MSRFKRNGMAVFIALAVLAAGGAAWAADTNTLTVSATVSGTCKFVAPKTSALSFTLDPSLGTNVTTSTTTTFWCTKGVTLAPLTSGQGLNYSGTKNQMKDAVSTDVIPYTIDSLTPDGNANAGPGLPRTLTITGTVLSADYLAKSAGTYSDTVLITLNN